MELQAIIGQLYIVDGNLQEVTAVPGVMAQRAPSKSARGRDKDSLFVHLSLTNNSEETAVLQQDLLEAISREYFQRSGSVTAALRQAVQEINQLLLRLNLTGKSAPNEGALTCAVLRSGELYTIQVGESLALLGRNYGVERLPAKQPARVTPLGRTAGIDIRYSHHRLHTGDILCLGDSNLAQIPIEQITAALVNNEIEIGLDNLQELIGDGSNRLLVVEFNEEAPPELPDITLPGRPSRRGAEKSSSIMPTPVPHPRREADPSPPTSSGQRVPQPERPFRTRSDHARSGRSLNMENSARQATSRAAMGLSLFTGWLARILTRLRPQKPDRKERQPWAFPALLAIIIPLVVVIVVTGVYFQRGRVRRFADIKIEMGQNLAQAEASGADTVTARKFYAAVLTLAKEADTIRPGDADVTGMRTSAFKALDHLDGITRLTATLLYEYPETTNLSAVILREGLNGGIFTLDTSNSTVYLHQTDESFTNLDTEDPEQLFFAGQAIGQYAVQNIIDMMWRANGSVIDRSGLSLLDSTGALISYFPNYEDKRAVPLGLASEWQLPVAITSFQDRLYILDKGAKRIWKYFPEGEGFSTRDGEREIYFNDDPDLEDAADLAIFEDDGSLALAYTDGRFRYYDTASGRVLWDESRLMENGLGSPLVRPTTVKFVGSGLNTSIYLADPGSDRILQISRGGTVLTQFRASDESGKELFDQITDFEVAERPLRIFVTTGSSLFLATEE